MDDDFRKYIDLRFSHIESQIGSLMNIVKISGIGMAGIVFKTIWDLLLAK